MRQTTRLTALIAYLFCGIVGACQPASEAQSGTRPVIRIEPITKTLSRELYRLGLVADVGTDGKGLIYIVDPTAPGIIVTNLELQPIGFFGRKGSGPREFREPVSIGALSDSQVAVLDRALGRLSFFLTTDDGAPLLLGDIIPVPVAPEAMCVLRDGHILIYGFSGGMRLHVFDSKGRPLRSFAPADSLFSPMALDLVTRGRIACDQKHDEIVVSSRFLPTVEAFSISTGSPVWTDTLAPFRPVKVEDRGQSVSISSGRFGFSLISSQFNAGDYRLFQSTYESRRDKVDADTVVTYIFSRSEGRWLTPQYDLPLLYLVNDGMVLSVEDSPDQFDQTIGLNRLITGRTDQLMP